MTAERKVTTGNLLQASQADLFRDDTRAIAERIDLPDADLCYYRDLLSNPRDLYDRLCGEIQWREDTIMMYGRPVKIPRLNAWYGDVDAHYSYSGLAMNPMPWNPLLELIRQPIEQLLNMRFNSVLINHYRDGNDSVSWHSDDEPELGREPVIASVSLGAVRRFQMRHRKDRQLPTCQLDLEPGSLLVMRGSTQRCWHHQVPKQRSITEGRINLTFRQILPVGAGRNAAPPSGG